VSNTSHGARTDLGTDKITGISTTSQEEKDRFLLFQQKPCLPGPRLGLGREVLVVARRGRQRTCPSTTRRDPRRLRRDGILSGGEQPDPDHYPPDEEGEPGKEGWGSETKDADRHMVPDATNDWASETL
jgi:hypothetical protein